MHNVLVQCTGAMCCAKVKFRLHIITDEDFARELQAEAGVEGEERGEEGKEGEMGRKGSEKKPNARVPLLPTPLSMLRGDDKNRGNNIVMYIHVEAARKSDCLGCAVLLCLVCLFDLACFFLSSFSSLICIYTCIYIVVCLTLLASFFFPFHLSLKHVYMYMYIM